ncbi:MAG: dipeptidase [Bacteroidales bacterium]|nr:dipeptidase [Candidatus Cacconaster merdequi]
MKRLTGLSIFLSLLAATAFTSADDEATLLARAERIHDRIISVDTHTDTALDIVRGREESRIEASPLKLKEGRVDCCFYPIYVGQKKLTDEDRLAAYSYAMSMMTGIEKYIASHPDGMAVALSSDDIIRYKSEGRQCFVMGLENGFPIGNDISKVKEFYDKGARIITLCHNYHNDICDAAIDSVTAYHGLSDFGRKVVAEMNTLGILVDLSHASTETLVDCIQYSKAPVIASHSCVYALKHHPRNLKDAEIVAIASKGGVVQVTTGKWALSDLPKEKVNISTFCDHVEYVRNLVGVEHVGIGTDFDGGGGMVQLENSSKMKFITVELLRRGWTEDDLRLFWGGNVLRVMKEVEDVAAGLQAAK